MKEAVVLYTGSTAGHLIPMVALAKRFLNHGFSASIVTFNHPHKPGSAEQEVSRLSSANPLISFHVFPSVSLDDSHSNAEPPVMMHATLEAQNSNLHNFLTGISKTSSLQAIIFDLFCMAAVDVANRLSIPAYVFTAFGGSGTAMFLDLLEFDNSSTLSLKDLGNSPTDFPGLPPLPASDFPVFFLDRESATCKSFMRRLPSISKSDGILMNTFESLEPKAISALREGRCMPGLTMPPFYGIGPLITESREKEEERHECLRWLDSQPKGSVVFLCFGSMGAFPPDQIKRIAIGLENSGQRFLWVVKVGRDPADMYTNLPEFVLDEVLPEGFLDRTKDRGTVVKTWAPQMQVLRHESVGGFVTHCGWNSILEAVTAGVSMVCWPLYAEQRLNKAVVVEEMRLGVAIEGYQCGMVEAEEVEAKVRWLMETEGGRSLKERTKGMKDKAVESFTEGGSSSQAFKQFLMALRARN